MPLASRLQEDLCLQGLRSSRLPLADWGKARAALYRELRISMPWLPTKPLPHGRRRDYLWNLLPWELEPDRSAGSAWEAVRSWGPCLVLTDDPRQAPLRIEAADLPSQGLKGLDLYVFPSGSSFEPEGRPVLMLDHEGIGPWIVTPGARLGRTRKQIGQLRSSLEEYAPTVIGRPGVERVRASVAPFARFLGDGPSFGHSSLRRAIGQKGIYVPEYALPHSATVVDNLWNYLPEAFECEGSFLETLGRTTDEMAVVFENRKAPAIVVPSARIGAMDGVADSLYIVDWPLRRWLYVRPKPYLIHGADSSFLPLFMPL